MAQGGKIDIRRLWQIAKRWKWLLIVPPIVALIAAYIYVATTSPLYTSSTTILLGANQYVTLEMSRIAPGTQVQNKQRMVDLGENIRQQLLSETTLNKVIERAGIRPSSGIRARAKEILRTQPDGNEEEIIRKLQIEWLAKRVETGLFFPKRGNYIQISITHTDPELAYTLTKNLAEAFIEESLQAEGRGTRETLEFASQQLGIYNKKLEEARERLRHFKTGVVRENTQTIEVNLQNEGQINTQIKSLRVEIASKESQLHELENELGAMKDRILIRLSGKAATLRVQMIEKISDVAVLMIQSSWRDPQVIKLNQDIASLREHLQQEIQATGAAGLSDGFSRQNLDLAVQRQMVLTDLEMLRRHKSVLEGLLQTYKQSLTRQPAQDLQLAQLQSEVSKLEEIVAVFQEQARGSQIREAMQRSEAEVRYKILDPANRPITPTNTDQFKILFMAVLGGLGCGVGIVYLLEFFDHSFKSVEEVEKVLGLTVLGTIPKLDFSEKK